eukprot:scaffold28195_cov46-Cyclotella_meneghiniana.AAC.4
MHETGVITATKRDDVIKEFKVDSMVSLSLLFLDVGPISAQIEVRAFKMRSLVRRSPVGLVIGDQQVSLLSAAS